MMFEHATQLLRPRNASQLSSVSKARRATGALIAALFLTCGSAAYANSSAASQTHTVAAKRMAARYATIPLSFEANQGQTDPSVQFLSRGSGYSMFLTRDEVVLHLERQQSAAQKSGQTSPAFSVDTLRMKLVDASPSATVAGADPLPGVVSYFIGNDPKKWHAGIRTYSKVNYAQVYPGVDLVFYGNQRQLEYDFVVAPGADASRIAWQIEGASPAIDAEGNLVLTAANGPASFKKPVLYQMDGDKKVAVEGSFEAAAGKIGFRLGGYDHSKPLIIDPVLSYASYLGGSGKDMIGNVIGNDGGTYNYTQGLAIDSEGSAYVTGTTYSTDFPVKNPYQSTNNVTPDNSRAPTTFVTKFSPDGSSLVYSTYLGGSGGAGGEYAYAIAVDTSNNAYVTGQTYSTDFPITAGAYESFCAPGPVGPAGSEASTCVGAGNNSVYVTKLNATGTALVYSTFLGGGGSQFGVGIAVDADGRAYVGGTSEVSCDDGTPSDPAGPDPYTCFPTTNGAVIAGTNPNGGDAPQYSFISVFDPTGAHLLYSSLFGDTNGSSGGNGSAWTTGVNVDASGNFYLVGWTASPNLPTTAGVIQPTTGPVRTGDPSTLAEVRSFIAKFNPVTTTGGASLAYATYLGGHTANESDEASGIAIDSAGNSYVTGFTQSADFPVTAGSYQTTCGPVGCNADFVVKLNSTATTIDWGTYLGDVTGSGDAISGTGPIALDGNGNVYVTGIVNGPNFPQVNPVEPDENSLNEAFVTELDPTGKGLLFSTYISTPSGSYSDGLGVDTAGNIYLAGTIGSTGLIVTPDAFQQTYNGAGFGDSNGFVAKIAAQGTAAVALVASPSPVSAGQTATLTATVTPTAKYASVPTGTVEFQDGSTTLNTAALNSSGVATYPTSTLAPGQHSLTAVYSGDNTYPTVNGTTTLTVNGLTATVAVTPASSSVSAATSLSVKVAVTGTGATPTGTVTLMGGSYTSPAESLSSGSYTFTIPANSLSAGTDVISVTYSGDSNYSSAMGTASVTVTATVVPLTPTVKVTPAAASVDTGASLKVKAAVTGAGATPTGTVTLSGGGYTSTAETLAGGSYTFAIAAGSLSAGTDTLTVTYSGDANYASGTGTASVTVTQSAFTLSATNPSAVSPGSAATSTVTVSSTTGYAGSVTLNCTLTSSPSGAADLPTCSAGSGAVTLSSSTASASATVTVSSTSSSSELSWPKVRDRNFGLGGGGAVLAFLVFIGLPTKRRSWPSLLGVLFAIAIVSGVAGCGGTKNSTGSGNKGTTGGSYTFTVTGTGSPSDGSTPTTSFTVTIN